jgi:4'-phosphopantetheinyl transferase EntD
MTSSFSGPARSTAAVVTEHLLPAPNGGVFPLSLLTIDVDGYTDGLFDAYGIAMPPTIARSVAKRRAEYLHGRLAARHALARFGLAHVQVGIGDQRQPLWPEGIIGSISHNRRQAGALALDGRVHGAVGIDLEHLVPADMCDTLWQTVVTPCEQAYLRELSAVQPLESLLTVVFSAKESFFKAAFPMVRRYFDFDAIALTAFDIERRVLEFEVREYLCPQLVPGVTRSAHYDWIAADTVCTLCNWPPP